MVWEISSFRLAAEPGSFVLIHVVTYLLHLPFHILASGPTSSDWIGIHRNKEKKHYFCQDSRGQRSRRSQGIIDLLEQDNSLTTINIH